MSTDAAKERPQLRSGKPLILATASLFLLVPLGLVYLIPIVRADLEQEPQTLLWAERASWEPLPVRGHDLEQGLMSQARNNAQYKDYGFRVPAEAELELMDLSRLAFGSPGEPAFESDAARQRIESARAALDDRYDFYPAFLLAKWHEAHGDREAAGLQYAEAFEKAEAVIARRYLHRDGSPAAGHDVGRIVLGFDQVEKDTVNTNLRLTYPRLEADEGGWVYLPVFKTVYRLEYGQDLTQPPPLRRDWFTFPGQFGQLEPITVRE